MTNKIFSGLLVGALLAALALAPLAARAQFNQFAEPATLVLAFPTNAAGLLVGNQTNGWVDTHGMLGIATVTFMTASNAPGGTLTATLEQSDDALVQVAGPSYALATLTSVNYTNNYYATNGPVATNSFLLAGTVTTPSASLAGFATPYLLPAPFTNTGAITVTPRGVFQVGYDIAAARRYVRVVWSPGGTQTNMSWSAVLRARKANYP